MQTLETLIKVYICGTPAQRSRVTELLSRVVGAGNTSLVEGFWHNETEPNVVLSTWLDTAVDNSRSISRIVRVLRTYQTYASQEAIFIEVFNRQACFALAVEAGDWVTAEADLQGASSHVYEFIRIHEGY